MAPKIRTYCIVAAAALFLSSGSRATASIQLHVNDTVKATLNQQFSIMGTGNTSLQLYNSNTDHSAGHLEETWNSSQGGLLDWTTVYVNNQLVRNASFYTACIEVLQNVYWGGQATWNVVDLASAPKPNDLNGLTSGTGGMGGDVAHLIEVLYDTHFTDAEASHKNAGAYQIAIWKLVYDGIGVIDSPNFATGRLIVTSPMTGEEVTLAKTWLAELHGLTGTSHPDVVALSSDGINGFQDQVYGGAPEPASLAVWSIITCGAAGLIVVKRRRASV